MRPFWGPKWPKGMVEFSGKCGKYAVLGTPFSGPIERNWTIWAILGQKGVILGPQIWPFLGQIWAVFGVFLGCFGVFPDLPETPFSRKRGKRRSGAPGGLSRKRGKRPFCTIYSVVYRVGMVEFSQFGFAGDPVWLVFSRLRGPGPGPPGDPFFEETWETRPGDHFGSLEETWETL